jgi:hypothetical protein
MLCITKFGCYLAQAVAFMIIMDALITDNRYVRAVVKTIAKTIISIVRAI